MYDPDRIGTVRTFQAKDHRMQALRVFGQVDELHQLSAAVPDTVRPGRVEIVVIVPSGEDDEAAWMQGVSHEWRDELNDPREDLYCTTDGDAIDGSR